MWNNQVSFLLQYVSMLKSCLYIYCIRNVRLLHVICSHNPLFYFFVIYLFLKEVFAAHQLQILQQTKNSNVQKIYFLVMSAIFGTISKINFVLLMREKKLPITRNAIIKNCILCTGLYTCRMRYYVNNYPNLDPSPSACLICFRPPL